LHFEIEFRNVSFYHHTKLLMIDSLPLCPVFKGAKRNQKWHPNCAGPSDNLVLLTVVGTLKNSASPQTGLTSFSNNSSDAQRHRMGSSKKSSTKPSHAAEQLRMSIVGSSIFADNSDTVELSFWLHFLYAS